MHIKFSFWGKPKTFLLVKKLFTPQRIFKGRSLWIKHFFRWYFHIISWLRRKFKFFYLNFELKDTYENVKEESFNTFPAAKFQLLVNAILNFPRFFKVWVLITCWLIKIPTLLFHFEMSSWTNCENTDMGSFPYYFWNVKKS